MSTTETLTQPVTVTQPITVAHPAITAENVQQLFPEVNTTVIGGSHASATSDNALDGYNEEQIRLMDEVCIVLDENDLPIGSATKKYGR
jgi:isopentenyl-diphosphate delta-isomerase